VSKREREGWWKGLKEHLPYKRGALSSNPVPPKKEEFKKRKKAGYQWLMPVILALERLRSGGLQFKASLGR
jgi:hypothetical protein